MDIDVFHSKFQNIISKLDIEGLNFYQFGSSLKGKVFKDIDVLIVYDSYQKMKDVKFQLVNGLEDWLLDIICLTSIEETELSFVVTVGAKRIFPPDSADLQSVPTQNVNVK